MKCEVEGCKHDHVMSVNLPKWFQGTRRICQGHWIMIMKANRTDARELPFRFRER